MRRAPIEREDRSHVDRSLEQYIVLNAYALKHGLHERSTLDAREYDIVARLASLEHELEGNTDIGAYVDVVEQPSDPAAYILWKGAHELNVEGRKNWSSVLASLSS